MKLTPTEHYDISLLYVEDEQTTREQVSRILQRIVTELYVAENGHEGLALYREKQPDIVMTDMMMPGMSGLEMVREIRRLNQDSQVIMLTAYSDTEYLLECISLGINQYVQKPVDFGQLAAAIETCSNYVLLKRTLHQQEAWIQMLSQAVEQAPIPIMLTSTDGTIEYVNAMFNQLTGYTSDEVLGRNPRLLKSGLTPSETYTDLWKTISHGREWGGEFLNKRKDGSLFWELAKICPLRNDKQIITGFLKASQDITERKEHEENLQYLGTHDPLTGLYNRAYFDAELQRLESGREYPVSIVMADIDGLKLINDLQGHDEGDRLIKGTAEVLLSAFRSSDVVARIGGDEFAVLLPRTDCETVMAAIQRVRACGSDPQLGTFARCLSLGASTADRPDTLIDNMKIADRLMYQDKITRKQNRPQGVTSD